ncbi:Mediator of RNA polymerase II transcription subunit 7 [Thoreauomyces humboldtii]|nr:Mediator of RNA polymerase II transcription subunit 7 [Thoreauomyces humboldtii]
MTEQQPPPPPPIDGAAAGEVTTAYPLPPRYFHLYTDAAVASHPEWQRDKAETAKAVDPYSKSINAATKSEADVDDGTSSVAGSIVSAGYSRRYMNPPRPPKGTYTMFGVEHNTDAKLPSLKAMGIPQAYPDGPIGTELSTFTSALSRFASDAYGPCHAIDFRVVLRNLLMDLLGALQKYLEVLFTDPEKFETQKDTVWNLLQNMHHVINEFRPHQARDLLAQTLASETAKKREMTRRLREFCSQTREEMQRVKTELMDTYLMPDGDDMDTDSKPATLDYVDVPTDPQRLSHSQSFEKWKDLQRRLVAVADSQID